MISAIIIDRKKEEMLAVSFFLNVHLVEIANYQIHNGRMANNQLNKVERATYDSVPKKQVTECLHTRAPSNSSTECPFFITSSDDVTECPHTRAPSDRLALFNVILIEIIMDTDTKSSIKQVTFYKYNQCIGLQQAT